MLFGLNSEPSLSTFTCSFSHATSVGNSQRGLNVSWRKEEVLIQFCSVSQPAGRSSAAFKSAWDQHSSKSKCLRWLVNSSEITNRKRPSSKEDRERVFSERGSSGSCENFSKFFLLWIFWAALLCGWWIFFFHPWTRLIPTRGNISMCKHWFCRVWAKTGGRVGFHRAAFIAECVCDECCCGSAQSLSH